MNLLASDPRVAKVDEPGIGLHLGLSIEAVLGLESRAESEFRVIDMRKNTPDYFFSNSHLSAWRRQLRRLILKRFKPHARGRRWLVIKEPHGGDAADVLLSVMPRSRMIFLLRDGRDVVDSELDAATDGSWAMNLLPRHAPAGDRLAHIERRALTWLRRTVIVERAFQSHPVQLRRLVRYEDLRADPAPILADLAQWLDLDTAALTEAASKSRFEHIPAHLTGPGKFTRAATPGLWRKNLSEEEQAVLEAILGAKVRDLYPAT